MPDIWFNHDVVKLLLICLRIDFASKSIRCYSNLSHSFVFPKRKKIYVYINIANVIFQRPQMRA